VRPRASGLDPPHGVLNSSAPVRSSESQPGSRALLLRAWGGGLGAGGDGLGARPSRASESRVRVPGRDLVADDVVARDEDVVAGRCDRLGSAAASAELCVARREVDTFRAAAAFADSVSPSVSQRGPKAGASRLPAAGRVVMAGAHPEMKSPTLAPHVKPALGDQHLRGAERHAVSVHNRCSRAPYEAGFLSIAPGGFEPPTSRL
jgi:hypothetical protein